jgi:hypothetical protein
MVSRVRTRVVYAEVPLVGSAYTWGEGPELEPRRPDIGSGG